MEMEEAKMDIFTNDVRHYPRSNARSRYRKPAEGRATARADYARRNNATNEATTASTFKERIVFQATICGGFLAVLLFFNIIDTGFTNGVMSWIEHNIAFDMLAEEGGVGGWVDSVMGIFSNDDAQEVSPHYEAVYEDTGIQPNIELPAQIETTETFQPNTVDSSRVDENILREIESIVDVYYESN